MVSVLRPGLQRSGDQAAALGYEEVYGCGSFFLWTLHVIMLSRKCSRHFRFCPLAPEMECTGDTLPLMWIRVGKTDASKGEKMWYQNNHGWFGWFLIPILKKKKKSSGLSSSHPLSLHPLLGQLCSGKNVASPPHPHLQADVRVAVPESGL